MQQMTFEVELENVITTLKSEICDYWLTVCEIHWLSSSSLVVGHAVTTNVRILSEINEIGFHELSTKGPLS